MKHGNDLYVLTSAYVVVAMLEPLLSVKKSEPTDVVIVETIDVQTVEFNAAPGNES
jgi:hypothetical protein